MDKSPTTKSKILTNLQLYGMSQEMCDEIDYLFSTIDRQYEEIKSLESERNLYRNLAGMTEI